MGFSRKTQVILCPPLPLQVRFRLRFLFGCIRGIVMYIMPLPVDSYPDSYDETVSFFETEIDVIWADYEIHAVPELF